MLSILNNLAENLSTISYVVIIIGALLGGGLLAVITRFKENYSNSFYHTVFILPAVVAIVILMVNGNLGTGIAVAGAFSLVRYRSTPGSAKEIALIFLAMGFGLIMGMGHMIYAYIFLIIMILANLTYNNFEKPESRLLRVTIPEDLDYSDIFIDVFNEYLNRFELVKVKTTNLGALYKLSYEIEMKVGKKEKDLLDQIRIKNGNLEVSTSLKSTEEL